MDVNKTHLFVPGKGTAILGVMEPHSLNGLLCGSDW